MDPTQQPVQPVQPVQSVQQEQAIKDAVNKERMAKVRAAKKKRQKTTVFNPTYLMITSALGASAFAVYYYRNQLKKLITTLNTKTAPVQEVQEVVEVVEETKPDAVQYVDSVVRNLTNSITEIRERLEQQTQQEQEPVVVTESPPALSQEQDPVEAYLTRLRGD